MVRTLPWLVSDDKTQSARTPARSRPLKRPHTLLDEDSDVHLSNSTGTTSSFQRRRNDKAVHSSTPNSPQPSRLAGRRTPSSSPPPPAPPIDYMKNGDEKWMMVEDEFYSMASTFTKHLHATEYKQLKKLAAMKSVETITALPRPTGNITTMTKQAQKNREQIGKTATRSTAPKENSKSDEEESPMQFMDRHLAGLMQGSPSARAPKRILRVDKAKSHTRAAAGYLKQEDGSPARPKERQRLPDLGDFMMKKRSDVQSREQETSPRATSKTTIQRGRPPQQAKDVSSTIVQDDDDDDDDDLDAIVPFRKPSAKADPSTEVSSTRNPTSKAPPVRDKAANLTRAISSSSSQSQKTYPRPALRREPSSAGSPSKKATFSNETQSSSRRPSVSTSQAVLISEKSNGEFAYMDLPIARSRLVLARKGARHGVGSKQSIGKEKKTTKLEEVPSF